MKADGNGELEAMDNNLRADIVKAILNMMSDMCVGAFCLSIVSMMYAYEQLCVLADSSSFR